MTRHDADIKRHGTTWHGMTRHNTTRHGTHKHAHAHTEVHARTHARAHTHRYARMHARTHVQDFKNVGQHEILRSTFRCRLTGYQGKQMSVFTDQPKIFPAGFLVSKNNTSKLLTPKELPAEKEALRAC